MTRAATPANESVLVSVALNGTAEHVEKLVRKYRWTQRRDAAATAQRQHELRNVSYFNDIDGTFVLNARLPPELGAVVRKALQTAAAAVRRPDDVSAETPLQIPANARNADALRHMAETYLAHNGEETGAGASADRVQVVVHIDQAILAEGSAAGRDEPHRCELEDGPALALDTARRLACDATVVGLVEGEDGEPLDIGRKTRSIPAAIARALKARDGGCRYPGCDRTRFAKGTTCSTGPTAGRRSSRTSSRCAAFTTGSCTRAATGSRRPTTGCSCSRGPTAGAWSRTARTVSAETFCRPSIRRTWASRTVYASTC
jgi:hypothetical protein